MASIFGHVLAASAMGSTFFKAQTNRKTLLLAGFCAFAPDLDVLGFEWGVSYGSIWGHRGFTHSLLFCGLMGVVLAWLFFRKHPQVGRIAVWCACSAVSHPLLDMLTDGGRGCALFWPWSDARLFFPIRPILVSPLGASNFFSAWGLEVLASEAYWIGMPALLLVAAAHWWRRMR
jgi:inner membrane protein